MFIFYMKSQYKVFKMALPLKINAEAQADASSDDPIWQNLIATQCIGSLTTDKLICGKISTPFDHVHPHTRKGLRNSNLDSLRKSVMKLLESKLSKDLQGVFDENICKEKLHSLFWAQTISRKIFLVFRWVLLKNPEDLIRFWLDQTQIKFCVGKIRKI